MATRVRGPYSVAFPVNFTSKGDTTRDAFQKHMDEITRIYGILTGLDADTLDASAVNDMLQKHIDSTNPHPKWKPSLSFADISGDLDGSKIIGRLTRATIDHDKINGLSAFVDGKISAMPTIPDKGDGITDKTLSQAGYVKFNNGLIIQWGICQSVKGGTIGHATFAKPFPTQCYMVTACTYCHDGQINGRSYGGSYCKFNINEWDKNGFGFDTQSEGDTGTGTWSGYASYIAIGV